MRHRDYHSSFPNILKQTKLCPKETNSHYNSLSFWACKLFIASKKKKIKLAGYLFGILKLPVSSILNGRNTFITLVESNNKQYTCLYH